VWASYDQAGSNSLDDVYAKILSPTGTTISNEFLVNQFTNYNQRSPAITALTNGGFVVAWVSEQERTVAQNSVTNTVDALLESEPSVDIYARLYGSNGVPQGNEFLVNTNVNPCADPSLASTPDGNFMVAWDERDMNNFSNSLDIYLRPFSIGGVGGLVERVNTFLLGDQYAPRIAAISGDYMITWTSLGEDGSREGVYGQFVREDGTFVGNEIRVNTTTVSQQMQPVVASDGVDQFLAVWTSYIGSPDSFDLFAQRYINVASLLDAMSAPFVYAPFTLSNNIYQPQLVVSWPPLLGIAVSNYEVYADGSSTAIGVVSSNQWTMTAANGLTPNSTHSFQIDYVTTAGVRSPLSPSASGTTWSGLNWYGIPYEWMETNFGNDISTWPASDSPIASEGPTVYQAFLSGGTANPATWLQQTLVQTSQGLFLDWNTQPGATYQVQVTTDLVTWNNFGAPRFEAGTVDSIYVGGSPSGYYRVVLLR